MAAPPVPSNSNNWCKGWISRPRSSHNCMLIFDTCAPKSIKVVTSHPSMTTGALLACPTNHATGSRFRNGMDAMPFHSFLVTTFAWVGFGLGPERKCCKLTVCCWRGVDYIPLGPPSLFNVLARVTHSLAMWPQPWHLKHWKVLESLVLWAPPCVPFCACIFPLLWQSTLPQVVVEELPTEAVWSRPVQPLWELG